MYMPTVHINILRLCAKQSSLNNEQAPQQDSQDADKERDEAKKIQAICLMMASYIHTVNTFGFSKPCIGHY